MSEKMGEVSGYADEIDINVDAYGSASGAVGKKFPPDLNCSIGFSEHSAHKKVHDHDDIIIPIEAGSYFATNEAKEITLHCGKDLQVLISDIKIQKVEKPSLKIKNNIKPHEEVDTGTALLPILAEVDGDQDDEFSVEFNHFLDTLMSLLRLFLPGWNIEDLFKALAELTTEEKKKFMGGSQEGNDMLGPEIKTLADFKKLKAEIMELIEKKGGFKTDIIFIDDQNRIISYTKDTRGDSMTVTSKDEIGVSHYIFKENGLIHHKQYSLSGKIISSTIVKNESITTTGVGYDEFERIITTQSITEANNKIVDESIRYYYEGDDSDLAVQMQIGTAERVDLKSQLESDTYLDFRKENHSISQNKDDEKNNVNSKIEG